MSNASLGTRFLSAISGDDGNTWFQYGGRLAPLFEDDPQAQSAFTFVDAFTKKHGKVPTLETIREATGLLLTQEAANAEFLFDQLMDRRIKRHMALTGQDVQKLLAVKPREALALMHKASAMLSLELATPQVYDFKSSVHTLWPWLTAKWTGEFKSVPFPWPTLQAMGSGTYGGEVVSIVARTGLGKAQPLDEPVLLADGTFKRMGDIVLGDKLASVDGAPSEVTGIYPQGDLQLYDVHMADGRATRACGDHLWEVHGCHWKTPRVLTTLELQAEMKKVRNSGRLSVQMVSGDFGKEQPTAIDPYILGVLIGDGCLGRDLFFTTMDDDIVAMVRKRMPRGHQLRRMASQTGGQAFNWSISAALPGMQNEIKEAVRAYGLNVGSKEKFIPKDCFTWGRAQRLELLQGLMDTDGTVGAGNCAQFSTSSPRLADDFRKLVWSLGGACPQRIKQTSHAPHYVLTLRMSQADPLFKCERKARKHKPSQYVGRQKNVIKSIAASGTRAAQCISVSHPTKLYVTRDYIVTHNTWLMLEMALHAWRTTKQPVVFVTLEIMARAIMERLAAMYTQTPMDELKFATTPTYFSKKNYKVEMHDKLVQLDHSDMPPFIVVDGNLAARIEDVQAVCHRYNPIACFIDGAYMLKHDNPRMQKHEKNTENIEAFKRDVATALDLAGYASWQFNRDATKLKTGEMPGPEHVGGGDGIPNTSSILLGIFQGDQSDNAAQISQRRVNILKGRGGERGQFNVEWDFAKMDFSEVSEFAKPQLHGIDLEDLELPFEP